MRQSYLPVNKLKDAPPAEKYEGKPSYPQHLKLLSYPCQPSHANDLAGRKPEEFMHEKGPGLGAQISQGVHNLKEKVVPHHKDK